METELAGLDSISNQAERLAKYIEVLDRLVEESNSNALDASFRPDAIIQRFDILLRHTCDENVALVISRPLLSHFAQSVTQLPTTDQFREQVLANAMNVLEPRLVSYEEHFSLLSKELAILYRSGCRWLEAARTLCRIPLESTVGGISELEKLQTYTEIAELFLKAMDVSQAETYVSRAAGFVGSCDQLHLKLQYEQCYANILYAKHKFMEACPRFYSLSNPENPVSLPSDNSRVQALELAVICAALSPAGPQRFNILRLLHRDSRTEQLNTLPLLDALYFSRLLRKEHLAVVSQTLLEKHATEAVLGIFKQAALEHNILAVSSLYINIFFEDLGFVVGASPDDIEKTAAKMIFENRMNAEIDQVAGTLEFLHSTSGTSVEADVGAAETSASQEESGTDVSKISADTSKTASDLIAWDTRIVSVCSVLDKCVPRIVQ
mmetsp:Transcript_10024/g.21032  ORF Transcript_10024/g.21032 Transcript_10024/m.21032 type:complete len:437 (+) Transcript_10024:90-1400(+)